VLQRVVVCQCMLQCFAVICIVMVDTHMLSLISNDILQCVAVRCSVLQCVAVYCSVLQCVAM